MLQTLRTITLCTILLFGQNASAHEPVKLEAGMWLCYKDLKSSEILCGELTVELTAQHKPNEQCRMISEKPYDVYQVATFNDHGVLQHTEAYTPAQACK